MKKTNKKNFSIIIPAYKAQDFIEECLDSIDNQIYFNNNDGDYEFLERASSKANVKILKERLFYYRIYNDSLTKSSDTGLKSDLRKEYHKKISNKFEYIEPVINDDCYLLNNLNVK